MTLHYAEELPLDAVTQLLNLGNASGATHRLGDRVTVRLVEAAPVAGALRFELLSEGLAAPAARRQKAEDRPRRDERGRKASRRDKNRGKTSRR